MMVVNNVTLKLKICLLAMKIVQGFVYLSSEMFFLGNLMCALCIMVIKEQYRKWLIL
jgi:hypothetical protein